MIKEWDCRKSFWALVFIVISYTVIIAAIIILLTDKADAEERKYKVSENVEIRIMNRSCAWDQNLLAGYMLTPAGTLWGCWIFRNDLVWFYSQGNSDVLRLPYSKFEIVTDGTEFRARPPRQAPKNQKEIET